MKAHERGKKWMKDDERKQKSMNENENGGQIWQKMKEDDGGEGR